MRNGPTPLAPYTHFSFCPVCGWEYETWSEDVEFRCFECRHFIVLRKDMSYPTEVKDEPSSRWFS